MYNETDVIDFNFTKHIRYNYPLAESILGKKKKKKCNFKIT